MTDDLKLLDSWRGLWKSFYGSTGRGLGNCVMLRPVSGYGSEEITAVGWKWSYWYKEGPENVGFLWRWGGGGRGRILFTEVTLQDINLKSAKITETERNNSFSLGRSHWKFLDSKWADESFKTGPLETRRMQEPPPWPKYSTNISN